MVTITLDKGMEQLKSVLETVSDELDSPISTLKINEVLLAIQQQIDGEEEDIELTVSLNGRPDELLIKSSSINFAKPKITITTDAQVIAKCISSCIG